jgi:hypothetical protein
MDVRNRLKSGLSRLNVRIRENFLADDLVIRLRWFLLFTGILAVYIGLQVGDDWYVREFATYDWARGLGY